jgi:hypothetical membrane protein
MSSTSPSPDLLTAARSHGATRERAREAIGLQISIFAFVLAGLVALVVFRLHPAPISGPDSLGQFAAIASAVTAIVVFVLGRVIAADPARHKRLGVLDIIDIAAFAFAHAMIALLGWTLAATIIEAGLIGAVVFPLPVLMLAGAAAGLTAYVTYFSATHLDLQLLATVLAARAFNLTLIVAGILVTTLARYATKAIPTTHPRGVSSVRTCLIIVGIFLGMVGVFPVDEHFALHTGVASGMVVAFTVLVIAVRWWVPGVSRTFLLLGYVFTLLIVVLSVFFAVGYYTLTAVELVAGTVVFTWIILFIRTADALKRDAGAGAVE